ncbi:hypothetical protein BRADI_1g56823v3, partial [Brachypodium distachyon]
LVFVRFLGRPFLSGPSPPPAPPSSLCIAKPTSFLPLCIDGADDRIVVWIARIVSVVRPPGTSASHPAPLIRSSPLLSHPPVAVFQLALQTETQSTDRPTMHEVVHVLYCLVHPDPPPKLMQPPLLSSSSLQPAAVLDLEAQRRWSRRAPRWISIDDIDEAVLGPGRFGKKHFVPFTLC